MHNTVTIESLLATHDQPFIVIDRSLQIVAVNQSYENRFSIPSQELVGKPCCAALDSSVASLEPQCRHHQFFDDVEAYADFQPCSPKNGSSNSLRVRGYPLIDGDGVIFLGESVVDSELPEPGQATTKMVGQSPVFRNLITRLDQAAAIDAPVLLTGETGTGKELAAEYVHAHSHRSGKKLVVVDCTVLGEELFETELFGHEKGAFTGALAVKEGLFQLADGGTLFLDEIGELPLSQQPKLLRALESGSFRRVGGTKSLRSNVRVISATHRNLLELVDTGEFREDLYYRLSVFPIQIPSLRERLEDVKILAEAILSNFGSTTGNDYRLAKPALERLCNYSFPGNIRELRNTLQLASALSQQDLIEVTDVHLRSENPTNIQLGNKPILQVPVQRNGGELSPLEDVEARYIHYLLEKHQGNRKKVAFEMSVSERTLYRKMKRFRLNNRVTAG